MIVRARVHVCVDATEHLWKSDKNLEKSFFSISQLSEPPSYWLSYRAQMRTDSQVTPEHLYHSKSHPLMNDDLMETPSWSPAFS